MYMTKNMLNAIKKTSAQDSGADLDCYIFWLYLCWHRYGKKKNPHIFSSSNFQEKKGGPGITRSAYETCFKYDKVPH